MLGDRIQSARRGTAGNDHVVRDVRFSGERYDLDVVGLVFVEGFLDKGQDCLRCWLRSCLFLACYNEFLVFKLRLQMQAGLPAAFNLREWPARHHSAVYPSPSPGAA
jgi:hypothetical protein